MICRIYRNLRNGKYSIQAREGALKGKVIGHADSIIINNAKFVVNEKSRQRVIRDQQKNVHAFVEGELMGVAGVNEFNKSGILHHVEPWPLSVFRGESIMYNPYKYKTFVYAHTLTSIKTASRVVLDKQGMHLSESYDVRNP